MNENEMVKSELANSSSDQAIYKQIGPCLVQQSVSEVKDHVDKRIGFIKGEM